MPLPSLFTPRFTSDHDADPPPHPPVVTTVAFSK